MKFYSNVEKLNIIQEIQSSDDIESVSEKYGISHHQIKAWIKQYELGLISTTCSLHDENLIQGIVPLKKGLIKLSKDYLEAQRRNFPFSNS